MGTSRDNLLNRITELEEDLKLKLEKIEEIKIILETCPLNEVTSQTLYEVIMPVIESIRGAEEAKNYKLNKLNK